MQHDDDTSPRPWRRIPERDRKFKRVKNIPDEIRAEVLAALEKYPNLSNRPIALLYEVKSKSQNKRKITLDMIRTILQS